MRERMVDQCIQALGRLAFRGIEIEMIRVQPMILEQLKEALGGSEVSKRVNPTLTNQTRSIMYVYSGTERAREYSNELRGVASVDGVGRPFTQVGKFRQKRVTKYAQLKPVGILVPATWTEFAQAVTDTVFRKQFEHDKDTGEEIQSEREKLWKSEKRMEFKKELQRQLGENNESAT